MEGYVLDRQLQIQILLDHYQRPRHRGALEDADVAMPGGNPGCGDTIRIHIKVGEGDTVEQIRFEGQGCTISQAAAELVSARMEGTQLNEIEHLDHEVIIDELGREVVMSRPRCATLALGTLKQAVKEYKDARR